MCQENSIGITFVVQRRSNHTGMHKLGERFNLPNVVSMLAQPNTTPKSEIKLCKPSVDQLDGVYKGKLDFQRSFLSPSTNARVRKGISYVKAGKMEQKRIVVLIQDVLHGWKFVLREYSIKRYQEISLQYFTIRHLQQQVACSPRLRDVHSAIFGIHILIST